MRIIVANRGEIARRIMRTAHRLGYETVAVYADPDAAAPFVAQATTAVRIGPAELAESYLSADAILAAAATAEATAIHPGYGFLAENAGFARAVVAAGLTWIGPHPDAIASMGSKIEARTIAESAGVPTIPGFAESQDPDDLAEAAERIGYPVLVKAAAGGGGKGIRIAHQPAGFTAALREASAEAQRTFADGDVIVERYITRPRHVEVQVLGDKHGNVIDFGTRECSVQRRYQKLIEEAPAPNLPDATRKGLRTSATELARAMGYDSAGTVEFIVDDETGDYFFLEMNTRLQVEHPVTEEVTEIDLVELMIRMAGGEPLPLAQEDVVFSGHAIEVRVNAEDAGAGFAPQLGRITHLVVPGGVRWDSGVDVGSDITPYYDPMLAKLIVAAPDRDAARRKLAAALESLIIGGVVTNTGFHRWLIEQPPFVAGRITTRYLDETEIPRGDGGAVAAAEAARTWSIAYDAARRGPVWGSLPGFRVTEHRSPRTVFLRDLDGVEHKSIVDGVAPKASGAVDLLGRSVAVNLDGQTYTFEIVPRSEHWAPSAAVGHGPADAVAAPFPAVVTEVPVSPGDAVNAGDVVVVIEAMKMLHSLTAAGPGKVDEVRVDVGDNVASAQLLVTFVQQPHDSPEEGQT